jgi:membrane-associated phospholipid phosphatase
MSRSDLTSANRHARFDELRRSGRLTHFMVGFTLSLGTLGVFFAIACGVHENGFMNEFDGSILAKLHDDSRANSMAVTTFKAITELGSLPGLSVVAMTGFTYFLLRRRFLLMTSWLIVVSGGGLLSLSLALKGHFQRERPQFVDPLANAESASFPSGHALGAAVCYGFFVYLLFRSSPRGLRHYLQIAMLAVLILAIGFSRLYLGLHFASDVLGGYAIGTAWLLLCITCMEFIRQKPSALISSFGREAT